MKKELLINACKEIDELFDLDPHIDLESEPETLSEALLEAITYLKADDILNEETITTIQQVVKDNPDVVSSYNSEVIKILQGLDIIQNEEEPKPEPKPEPESGDDMKTKLADEIESAERLADLKSIAKEYDEFKDIRGKLTSYKTVDDLREVMLDILDGVQVNVEPQEPEKPREKEH